MHHGSDAVKVVCKAFFNAGTLPIFDYRDIREKGADLITTGGQAPGPEPLRICINKLTVLLRSAVGRKLTPLEAHDMSCIIADAVLAGGIRRAAMISLFDRDDEEMITCKANVLTRWNYVTNPDTDGNGEVIWEDAYGNQGVATIHTSEIVDGKLPWYKVYPYRARSNNSAVLLRGEVTKEEFEQLMVRVEESGCGEPGIYWTNDKDWGTNPCCRLAA